VCYRPDLSLYAFPVSRGFTCVALPVSTTVALAAAAADPALLLPSQPLSSLTAPSSFSALFAAAAAAAAAAAVSKRPANVPWLAALAAEIEAGRKVTRPPQNGCAAASVSTWPEN
jgi:hypothetical protein